MTRAEVDGWDEYWRKGKSGGGRVYDSMAEFYRKVIIRPSLEYFVKKSFEPGIQVLHAGCGSGQVDKNIGDYLKITALDYSINALALYKKYNKDKGRLLCGDIFAIPLVDNSMDGIYNLGVVEHFSKENIQKILLEFKRVLKPGGKVVLFWPHEYGFSVTILKFIHFIIRQGLKKDTKLHPDEICRVRSRRHAESIVNGVGFKVIEYYFGLKDLFTQSVVVLTPEGEI